MNLKKTSTLAMTAMIGLSLLATPLVSHAQTNGASTQTTKTTSTTSPIKIGGYISQKLNSGDVLKYTFTVTHPNKLITVATLSAKDAKESVDVKDKISVVVKDSKGKVVSKESATSFMGVNMDVTNASYKAGKYTIEIHGLTGIPAEGLDMNFALENDTNPDFAFNKITSSKTGVLPQNVSTTLTPSATDKNVANKVEIKAPSAKTYKVVRDYSSKTNYVFKASKTGTYTVKFTLADENGTVHTKTTTIKVVKAQIPSKVKVSASKSVAKAGQKVIIKNSAKGSYLEYKTTYKLKTEKTAHTLKNYTTSKTATFTAPKKKGTYTITTYVKQHNGAKTVKASKIITVK